ncbi:MAG: hypothetical protein KatS3mg110_2997 [Pirellulaceae bacterium]|nr:MAG: hypothetical protein KatS3mg110_2997 [Pirellulaceae bacterium]
MRKTLLLQLVVLVVWIGLGGLLGYLRGKVAGRNFSSQATVFYEPTIDPSAGSSGRQGLKLFLTSDQVIEKAIREGQLGRWFEFHEDPNVRETLRSRIEVYPDQAGPGAYRVAYYSRTAEAAQPTLDALLEAARQALAELYSDAPAEYLQTLQEAQRLLEQRWRSLRAIEPAELPPVQEGADRISYWQAECDRLRRQVAWLQGQAQRASSVVTPGSHPSADSPAAASSAGSRDSGALPEAELPPSIAARDEQLELRRRLLEPLLERQRQLAKNFGPDHAEVKEVRRRIEIVTSILARSPAPPAAAVPLLVEEQILLDQFGPAHPKVQEVRKKIKEILDASVDSATTSLPGSRSSRSEPTSLSRSSDLAERSSASQPTDEGPDKPLDVQLAEAETQLAYLEHALAIARYEAILDNLRSQMEHLAARWNAGADRLRVLTEPSAARWVWQYDLRATGLGGAAGLLAGIVFSLFGQLVGRPASRDT